MVRQVPVYLVKRRNKRFEISKDDLKRRNLEIVAEFKAADKSRRGSLLGEYYDLNKPFITYFPMFHGDYREEIINTFIGMIPQFFDNFDPARGVDVNSYLSMFCKKHAVREFLFYNSTVMYNKFTKGPDGKQQIEKASMISLDGIQDSRGGNSREQVGDEDFARDKLYGATIFGEFINGCKDGAAEFLDDHASYARYFDGETAKIIKDFESGLRWHEVREKHGFTPDRFLSIVTAIRIQLKRILKSEGKDVRFITKRERSERKRQRIAEENRRAASSGANGSIEQPGDSESVRDLPDWTTSGVYLGGESQGDEMPDLGAEIRALFDNQEEE